MAIAVFFRYSSLAALVAALFAPLYAFWLFGWSAILPVVIGDRRALLVWRHRENIARLAAGTETRLGRKRASPSDPNAASR